MSSPIPSIYYLKECFLCNPEEGILIWKSRPRWHFSTTHGMKVFNGSHAGNIAGTLTSEGYIKVGINGADYKAHRIIYKIHFNKEPNIIDHINFNRACNKVANLRSGTQAENIANKNPEHENKVPSGVAGINYKKSSNAWIVRRRVGGRTIHIGTRKDLGDAKRLLSEFDSGNNS